MQSSSAILSPESVQQPLQRRSKDFSTDISAVNLSPSSSAAASSSLATTSSSHTRNSASVASIEAPSSQSSLCSLTYPLSASHLDDLPVPKELSHDRIEYVPPKVIQSCESSDASLKGVSGSGSTQHNRQNPRRHRPQLDRAPVTEISTCRLPPPLVRQGAYRTSFVDSLVDTTTQVVQTVWPAAENAQIEDPQFPERKPRRVALRSFIQEVLRRSKTSYSTLQVSLYYLVLLRSYLPTSISCPTSQEPTSSCSESSHQADRTPSPLRCGRRMFIASLIAASKYLQDRNFSTNAWSKISGLSIHDLIINERAFLATVHWNLHVPAPRFHRWTEIVLRFSPSAQTSLKPYACSDSLPSWRDIVLHVTPELDNIDFPTDDVSNDSGYDSPGSELKHSLHLSAKPSLDAITQSCDPRRISDGLHSRTSNALNSISKSPPSLPPSPRQAPLPTPDFPSTGPMCTPAASIIAPIPRRRASVRRLISSINEAACLQLKCDKSNHESIHRKVHHQRQEAVRRVTAPIMTRGSQCASSMGKDLLTQEGGSPWTPGHPQSQCAQRSFTHSFDYTLPSSATSMSLETHQTSRKRIRPISSNLQSCLPMQGPKDALIENCDKRSSPHKINAIPPFLFASMSTPQLQELQNRHDRSSRQAWHAGPVGSIAMRPRSSNSASRITRRHASAPVHRAALRDANENRKEISGHDNGNEIDVERVDDNSFLKALGETAVSRQVKRSRRAFVAQSLAQS